MRAPSRADQTRGGTPGVVTDRLPRIAIPSISIATAITKYTPQSGRQLHCAQIIAKRLCLTATNAGMFF
jgi:hypothetical protein